MVEGLGITGIYTPDDYMAAMNAMTLTEYIESEETKMADEDDDE